MDYRTIKSKKHCVYDNIEEFSAENPNIMPLSNWRKGEKGDWVYSDDNRIIQILKRGPIKHPNDRLNYSYADGYLRTVVGSFIINKKTFMDTDFDQHKNRYTFSKTIGNKKNIKTRKNPTNKERIFTTSIVAGHGAVKSYMDAFDEIDLTKAKKKAVILLKQERIMKEVEKGVLDVAKAMGLDHEYVLQKLMHLADFSDDDNIVLQSSKELGKIIGTSGVTVKSREMGVLGVFQGFSPEQLGKAERKLLDDAKVE